MDKKTAIITGASGGIGFEITKSVANSGYRVIMACQNIEKANIQRELLVHETGNHDIEVKYINLASLRSVSEFADELLKKEESIRILMNNAGTIATCKKSTEDGIESTTSINYISHYLLVRKLLPLMSNGTRIVNMVSCTYTIGKIDFPDFFIHGSRKRFNSLSVYSNTKLALLLFTFELSGKLKELGIVVNAVDPGVVSTNIISMKKWFDPLTDIFFRPFIRTPKKGASTAIDLLLNEKHGSVSGKLFAGNKMKKVGNKYTDPVIRKKLWRETEKIVEVFL
ncbi:MAG: SDR family oxidoreductase [Rikenellaceae bacterium]|nr:SDR family oxidoreductase [Rikenellaceae bacterium]